MKTSVEVVPLLGMLKPYVVSMEGPRGILSVVYDGADDIDAFEEAARIVSGRINDLDPISLVEIMRPDATPMEARPTAEWMTRFAETITDTRPVVGTVGADLQQKGFS